MFCSQQQSSLPAVVVYLKRLCNFTLCPLQAYISLLPAELYVNCRHNMQSYTSLLCLPCLVVEHLLPGACRACWPSAGAVVDDEEPGSPAAVVELPEEDVPAADEASPSAGIETSSCECVPSAEPHSAPWGEAPQSVLNGSALCRMRQVLQRDSWRRRRQSVVLVLFSAAAVVCGVGVLYCCKLHVV